MPNGYDYSREYGGHAYGERPDSRVDCKFKCGCWVGSSSSGGPVGLDPFSGECPNNPISGQRLPGNADYEIVVTRRIRGLESAVYDLRDRVEKAEKRVGIKKTELAEKLEVAEEKIKSYKRVFGDIAEMADRRARD